MHFDKNIINHKTIGKKAIEILNNISNHFYNYLFVVDDNNILIGSLTDGDIRRGILNGFSVDDKVSFFMNKKFRYLNKNFDENDLKKAKKDKLNLIPIIDNSRKIVEILDLNNYINKTPLSAVIMAGGRGSRLLPLTKNKPKPLLEIEGKPIIEYNIERLVESGVKEIFITVNYLKNQIKEFFNNREYNGVSINFIEEKKPLGTIGSLSLINHFTEDNILLINSDILTNLNFYDFYDFHREKDAQLTIATVPYKVNLPYAVMDVNQNNLIKNLEEKPEFNYYINAGIYILDRKLIKKIPNGKYYDATDLIIRELTNKKIFSFPIYTYWLDVGSHNDLEKARNEIKNLF